MTATTTAIQSYWTKPEAARIATIKRQTAPRPRLVPSWKIESRQRAAGRI